MRFHLTLNEYETLPTKDKSKYIWCPTCKSYHHVTLHQKHVKKHLQNVLSSITLADIIKGIFSDIE